MMKGWFTQNQLVLLFGSLLVLSSTSAMAETYVAGMAGVTVEQPGGVSLNTGAGNVATQQDAHYANSVMYGAKIGHYFSSTPWLGIELEAFTATPNSKQQDVTLPGGSTVNRPGITQRVTTLAANVMARMPNKTLQPYVGVDPAIMFGHINATNAGGQGESTTVVGFNGLAGVRWLVTELVVLFVEAKYNYAKFNYAENGIKANYDAFTGAAGLGFQF